MTKLFAVIAAFSLLVSCSEAGVDAPSSAPTTAGNTDGTAGKKAPSSEGPGPAGKDEGAPDKRKPTGGESPGEGRDEDDAGVDGSEGDGDAFEESGEEDDDSSAVYPAAGAYVYAQSGFEKFCGGGRCERRALPKRQTARITLRAQRNDRAVVITETSASDDRMLRTTVTYSRSQALITDVYTRLSYEGVVFENEYRPAPPVESLRFPLEDGATWRGSWEDSTSGDYVVRVFGPTGVTVAGRAVRAWQVATSTEFRGDFKGEAKTLSWIDPATKAIVKLNGSADLTSIYGRYVTEFSTTLRSGPPY